MLLSQMSLPVAILHYTRLLCLQAAYKTQKPNLILWQQGPRFPQELNKLVCFCIPKLVGLYKVQESINIYTQTWEGMERDLVSEELLQQGE